MKREGCILLAEDDENDVLFLRRAFAQAGVRAPLEVVPDGQAAIDYLASAGAGGPMEGHPEPHLLLLDLQMPKKNGLDVLAWIRSRDEFCSLPVIIFSSSVNPGEIETAYRRGANAFVTKPSGTAERLEFARMIDGFWLTFNRMP